MKKEISIAIIGSINLDIVAHVRDFPQPGETVTNAVVHRFPGGKGANQALAAKRLGAEVALIACVGADAEATAALALLREEGVDLSACSVHSSVATGVALISVAASGENQIVVAPGANRALSTEEIALPVADAFGFELRLKDTTANESMPMLDRISVTME